MKALTLWPEWAWAIVNLGKRVENRGWMPSLQVGDRFAIHAGKYLGGRKGAVADGEALRSLMHITDGMLERPPARLSDVVPTSCIVATVVYLGCDREQRTPWDVPGEWHWRLGDVRCFKPIPVPRGRQGLWPCLRLEGRC